MLCCFWFYKLQPDNQESPTIFSWSNKAPKNKSLNTSCGDETSVAFNEWKAEYPDDSCPRSDLFATHEYGQKVLSSLQKRSQNVLSKSNADLIGCHLWTLSETSYKKTGHQWLKDYFFDHLPKILDGKHKDISLEIRCAMIGSPNRN